jgi:serine/threonine protein kinase
MKPLEPGDQLDQYRLKDRIARTNTASLFKATDVDSGRTVALKIPHLESESDIVFFDRFRREAVIGRELDHPGVTKAFPSGGQTRVYIAMEWVEGQTLRATLEEQGKIPVERAVSIAIQICEALEYIHSRGVIHRDLKPENVVLGPNDQVKLVDFGIAAKAGDRRLTFGKLSTIMGTPDYISPEQVKGKRGDARSDVYAMGVMLFEMLTGHPPFRGDNPLAVMNDRLVNNPISDRKADAAIDSAMKAMVQRATALKPEHRYQSARELRRHLENPDTICAEDCLDSEVPYPITRRLMLWSGLAMIPTVVFLLLLYVAHQQ